MPWNEAARRKHRRGRRPAFGREAGVGGCRLWPFKASRHLVGDVVEHQDRGVEKGRTAALSCFPAAGLSGGASATVSAHLTSNASFFRSCSVSGLCDAKLRGSNDRLQCASGQQQRAMCAIPCLPVFGPRLEELRTGMPTAPAQARTGPV